MEKVKKGVTVLFLGSIVRPSDYPISDKATDEIDFGRKVRIGLIRIPKPKRELYGRMTSVTQTEPIKNFEIYFRNLEAESGRYAVLYSNGELMATSSSDILLTPRGGCVTDMLVLRGVFSRLSLVVYGQLVGDEETGGEQGALLLSGGAVAGIGRDIFSEKRWCVEQIQQQLRYGSGMLAWQESRDDEIHEPQISNICHIAQHLYSTFDQIDDETYIAKFRENIQNINNILAKFFKTKHIGLYYPKAQQLPLPVHQIPALLIKLALDSLKLLPSDQIRVLEMLRMLAQLPNMATAIIENDGIPILIDLFLKFFSPNAFFFSSFKNVLLEVCISLAQWPQAAVKMVQPLEIDHFEEIHESAAQNQPAEVEEKKDKTKDKAKEKGKEKGRQRSRSRQKRSKKQKEELDEEDSGRRKKDKKDKKDKKKKDKERDRNKKRDKSKGKDSSLEKQEQRPITETVIEEQKPKRQQLSFYEILPFLLVKEKNSKTQNLIKILVEQITQTLTKNKEASEQMAYVTSFLRDTKYLFSQGAELINSKSLKIFATFDPFLNDMQSDNVDCKFISEHERLKEPQKNGISPKNYRIVSKIAGSLGSDASKLGYGTPFDQSYMVMMSELIFEQDKPIFSGFTQIVGSFKADGLMHLQRNEAALSITAEYIYKTLLEDDGPNTLLFMEQIHTALIKLVGFVQEDPSLFSPEFKSRLMQLKHLVVPYEPFSRSEGVFKVFCEYFLRLFKYQNYELEINNKGKLTDFSKSEYPKLVQPYRHETLSNNFALRNFHQAAKLQPLLELDACLKVFLVLADFNRNIWTLYYENKLVNGISSLFGKISSLLLFLLSDSPDKWTTLAGLRVYEPLVDDYLTVIKHIMMLLTKKCRYEAAYNDLLDEDLFEDVELYQKCIELYMHLHQACHSPTSLLFQTKSIKNAQTICSLTVELLDQFISSYELINASSRELKLLRIFENIYVKHYSVILGRAGAVALLGHLIKFSEGASAKLILNKVVDGAFSVSRILEKEVAYVPDNERSLVENVIKSNLFRADAMSATCLASLVANLFSKPSFVDKSLDIIEKLFDEIDAQYKRCQEEEGQLSWTIIRKTHLFSQLLVKAHLIFRSRLDDKLLRFLRRLIESFRKRGSNAQNQGQQQDLLVFYKTKNNFMEYFGNLITDYPQTTVFMNFFEAVAGSLKLQSYQSGVVGSVESDINLQVLKSCRILLQILGNVGNNAFYQCHLLYGEVLENPYRPQTFINFNPVLLFSQGVLGNPQNFKETEISEVKLLVSGVFYFLCTLTSIDGHNFFSTETRRTAISHLLNPGEKEFPFKSIKGSPLLQHIPADFMSLLEEYFSFPIQDKPIKMPPKSQVKPSSKPKTSVFSKSMFSVISEHDPVSKARYKYIGGEWIGGDCKKTLYTPFRNRNYQEQVSKVFISESSNRQIELHLKPHPIVPPETHFNNLFTLQLEYNKQEIPKKQMEVEIQLREVVSRMAPPEPKPHEMMMSPEGKGVNMMGKPSMLSTPPSVGRANSPNKVPIPPIPPHPYEQPGRQREGRNSNPRSGSQGDSQGRTQPNPNYAPPPRDTRDYRYGQAPPPNSYMPPPAHYNPAQGGGYPPPNAGYPPGYYNYPPARYPPQYGPPPGHPSGGYYPPPPNSYRPPAMYGSSSKMLSPQEEQLFQEAYALVNELKKRPMSEPEKTAKKDRLNHILSNHSSVHSKLKESLLNSN